jgi:hypothetical protein
VRFRHDPGLRHPFGGLADTAEPPPTVESSTATLRNLPSTAPLGLQGNWSDLAPFNSFAV